MKKILALSVFCLLLITGERASASSYRVDDAAVESVLTSAKPIAMQLVSSATSLVSPYSTDAVMADKNVWIAVLLDFFLGGIAIHRVYLGGTPVLILGYFITFFGIFGLIPLIDLIVLIISNQDISKYVGSNKFFMW